MCVTIAFIFTAAVFVGSTLAKLHHQRWARRLPALEALPPPADGVHTSAVRCSVIVAARDEEARALRIAAHPRVLNSVRTELSSRAEMHARFPRVARWCCSKPPFRLIPVVGATPQRKIADGGLAALDKGHDVMEFQETGFLASTLVALKRATSAVARPHVTLHRRRNVARPRGRSESVPRPICGGKLRL